MVQQSVVDGAFLVGLGLILVKFADFLLLERQKRWIDEKTKALHQRLASVPLKKFFSWTTSKPILIVEGCILVLGAAIMFWSFYLTPMWDFVRSIYDGDGWHFPALGIGGLLTVQGVRFTLWLNDLLDFPEELLEPVSVSSFAKRYAAVLILALSCPLIVLVGALPLSTLGFGAISTVILITCVFLSVTILLPVSIWFSIVACALLPAIAVTFLAAASIFSLVVFRGFIERLLEHNKGVYAALVFLATTVLGVMKYLYDKHYW